MCPMCGQPPSSERATYCSNSCRQAAYYQRRNGHNHPTSIMGVATERPGMSRNDQHVAGTSTSRRAMRLKFSDEQMSRRLRKSDRDLLYEIHRALAEHAHRGGTAVGFSRILQRIARTRGVELPQIALPRAVREELGWIRETYDG